jgi:hypothetical protein
MFLLAMIGTGTRSISCFYSNDMILQMRTSVSSLLFHKCLRVATHMRREGKPADIIPLYFELDSPLVGWLIGWLVGIV